MDRPLFVYGTLADSELLGAVLGRPVLGPTQLAAIAPGFAALCHGEVRRAALARVPGGAADGLVIVGLSAFEMDLLDAYLDGDYRRSIIAVMIEEELHEADAYLPARPPPQGAAPWSLMQWQQDHKPHALVAAATAAAQLRDKLIAIRPN